MDADCISTWEGFDAETDFPGGWPVNGERGDCFATSSPSFESLTPSQSISRIGTAGARRGLSGAPPLPRKSPDVEEEQERGKVRDSNSKQGRPRVHQIPEEKLLLLIEQKVEKVMKKILMEAKVQPEKTSAFTKIRTSLYSLRGMKFVPKRVLQFFRKPVQDKGEDSQSELKTKSAHAILSNAVGSFQLKISQIQWKQVTFGVFVGATLVNTGAGERIQGYFCVQRFMLAILKFLIRQIGAFLGEDAVIGVLEALRSEESNESGQMNEMLMDTDSVQDSGKSWYNLFG